MKDRGRLHLTGRRIIFGLSAACLFLAGNAAAQDTHHWTIQHGTRSNLLGGAVIGSHLDLSSTFYNPGSVVLLDDPFFLLSVAAVERHEFQVKGGEGYTADYSPGIRSVPSIVTGTFPSSWTRGNTLAYSYIPRRRLDIRIQTYRVRHIEDPSAEESASEIMTEQNFVEDWYGLTYSFHVGENAGLGITQYLAYRNHRLRDQVTGQFLLEDGSSAMNLAVESFEYTNFRTLAKIGFAWDADPWTAGLAMTTPSLNLWGQGSTYLNLTSAGLGEDDYYFVDYQDDLDAEYRSSWAVGAGFAYRIEKARIHASVEWYDGIESYEVMKSEEKESPGGEVEYYSVSLELKDVLNWGVGVEYVFENETAIYGSFIVDRSAAVKNPDVSMMFSTWDIYHLNFGGAFNILDTDFTLGIGYSFGSDDLHESTLNIFDRRDSEIPIPSRPETVEYTGLKFVLGFEFSS